MLTPEQKLKLKSAGYSDAQIIAYQAKQSTGFAPISQTNLGGFSGGGGYSFKELGQDIAQTGRGIVDTAKQAFQKQTEAFRADQPLASKLTQSIGIGAGGASGIAGEIFKGGVKAVLPQAGEEKLKSGVQKVVSPIIQSEPVQNLISKYESLDENTKRDVDSLLGVGSFLTDIVGGVAGKQATKNIAKGAITTGAKVAETGADIARSGLNKVAPTVKELGGNVKDFAVTQITGLEPETIKTIINSPDALKAARESGFNRSSLATEFETNLNKRLDDLSEIGKQYDTVRESGDLVKLQPKWLDSEIENQGFIIKDGKIRANTKSPTRDSNDIAGLQKIYDDWKGKDILEADEFLNFRYDLSKISKFGKEVGKSDELENISRSMRESLNKNREQLNGLKELDETYAPEIKELSKIRKEFLDVDGNLKDTAINRIYNSTKTGKDQVLNRVKTIVPDIEARANLVRAIEDIQYAKGQKVGSYTRAILGGGLLFSGNVPAGIAMLIFTNPDTVVKALTFISKRVSPQTSKVIGSITSKLQSGAKLNKQEAGLFAKILKSKTALTQAIESIGSTAGVGVNESVRMPLEQK